MNPKRFVSRYFFLALLLSGCASTHLRSTWRDPAYQFTAMRKVLVMGIGPTESTQRTLEDAFVANLAKNGPQGIPSYTLSPASAKLDEAGWRRLVSENNIDAVLVSRLTDVKTVEREVPPTTTTVATGGAPAPVSNNGGFIGTGTYNPAAYNSGWYGYYNTSYQVMSTPGYTVKDQYAVIETKLFEAQSGRMVWTSSSDTALAQGIDNNALASEFARIVSESIFKR